MAERYDVYPGGPQGRPDLPWELSDGGQVDDRDGVTEAPGAGAGPWCVVVEYANGADDHPPTLLEVLDDDLPTRADAEVAARRRAFEFEPPDPYLPQRREVYEDGPGFLTVIQGATKPFHFTTRVVRSVGVRR